MKKHLALTTAMAATLAGLSGCSSQNEWGDDVVVDRDTRVCVDQNGYRVEDNRCGQRSGMGGIGTSALLWYYVGRGNRVPYYGDRVNDPQLGFKGSYFPTKGAQYASAPAKSNLVRTTSVSRGGFGSTGRSFGGGRS